MKPASPRPAQLDGGWWPRTTDLTTELPALVAAMGDRRGAVSHVLLNAANWDMPHPARMSAGGRSLRLGWFTSQPACLMTMICEFGEDRFDVLIVPTDTSPASATTAMTAAGDGNNTCSAEALLTPSGQ
jgi:hypothetical protein